MIKDIRPVTTPTLAVYNDPKLSIEIGGKKLAGKEWYQVDFVGLDDNGAWRALILGPKTGKLEFADEGDDFEAVHQRITILPGLDLAPSEEHPYFKAYKDERFAKEQMTRSRNSWRHTAILMLIALAMAVFMIWTLVTMDPA